MRFLSALVLVEGNSDVDFLEPVLSRALEGLARAWRSHDLAAKLIPAPREYLPILGERMPLDALRALPSFQEFENDVVRALREMGWTR